MFVHMSHADAKVENIKQEVKREGRGPGHFGNPLALAQMKAEVKQETKQETWKPGSRCRLDDSQLRTPPPCPR